MAEIQPTAYTVAPGKLIIGDTGTAQDWAHQVTSASCIPDTDVSKPTPVLSGGQIPGDFTENWKLDVEIIQDLGAVQSIVEYCFKNSGKEAPFEFIPAVAKNKRIKGVIQIVPLEIGGKARTKPTAKASFQIIGRPTLEDVPA